MSTLTPPSLLETGLEECPACQGEVDKPTMSPGVVFQACYVVADDGDYFGDLESGVHERKMAACKVQGVWQRDTATAEQAPDLMSP